MKKIALYIMAFCYVLTGLNHFIHPDFYYAIMPPWLPGHAQLIFISGLLELLLGLLLLPIKTRRFAAWSIIILLIAIFPANIQMSVNHYHQHNPAFWLTILRLPFQGLFIWWAWLYTAKISIR